MTHSIKWKIPANDPELSIEREGNLPNLAAKLLAVRGITRDRIEPFLNPTLAQLPPPDSLCGIKQAVDVLVRGVEKNIPVIVYGDYDADGITGTALLTIFLKKAGFHYDNYIPDRLTEGYSLHTEALSKLKERNIQNENDELILLTVDCGISNHQEVKEAKSMGYSVIITDHHRPSETLPDADAIVNPHLPECDFPFKDLAGVGVAFYLIAALRARLTENNHWQGVEPPNLKEYLDLVTLGTVADMVSLTDVNRILVKGGLEIIRNSPRPGIKALLKKANIQSGSVSTETISYQIAPRLNAAGRTGDPSIALDLLTAENNIEAEEKASFLEEVNLLRREISEHMFAEASILAEKELASNKKGLVLAKVGWHKGMLGLVASRIASKYDHPTIIFTIEEDGTATGSGRSVHGLDIHSILDGLSDRLIRFGGHKAAVGLAIENDHIDDFKESFVEKVSHILNDVTLEPVIDIDVRASIEESFAPEFLEIYCKFEPFGFDNRQPVFYDTFHLNEISAVKRIGAGSIKFTLERNNTSVECVGFGKAEMFNNLSGENINIAYKITLNEFRGLSNWEARVEDAKENHPTP